MIVELAVRSLISWTDTMQTQFARTSFARIDKTLDIFAQCSNAETITRTNNGLVDS